MKEAIHTQCGSAWIRPSDFTVFDEEVRAFYRRFGFVDLPGDPRRAMIVRMTDLELSGFGG